MARGATAAMRTLRVRAPTLVAAYWAEMARHARGAAWSGLVLYACGKLLDAGYRVEDFVELALRGSPAFEFCVLCSVLPGVLGLVVDSAHMGRLLSARSEEDLDGVFGGKDVAGFRSWRRYLLDDVRRARGHYLAFLRARSSLRAFGDAFLRSPRARVEVIARAASALGGLVVVADDVDLYDGLREAPETRGFVLLRGPSARSALLQVHPRRLLARTAIGAVDGVLGRVMAFHSHDVLALVSLEVAEAASWPEGARVVVSDSEAAGRLARKSAVYLCVDGTMARAESDAAPCL